MFIGVSSQYLCKFNCWSDSTVLVYQHCWCSDYLNLQHKHRFAHVSGLHVTAVFPEFLIMRMLSHNLQMFCTRCSVVTSYGGVLIFNLLAYLEFVSVCIDFTYRWVASTFIWRLWALLSVTSALFKTFGSCMRGIIAQSRGSCVF